MSGHNGDPRPPKLPWRSAKSQQPHPLVLGLVILILVTGVLALVLLAP